MVWYIPYLSPLILQSGSTAYDIASSKAHQDVCKVLDQYIATQTHSEAGGSHHTTQTTSHSTEPTKPVTSESSKETKKVTTCYLQSHIMS